MGGGVYGEGGLMYWKLRFQSLWQMRPSGSQGCQQFTAERLYFFHATLAKLAT